MSVKAIFADFNANRTEVIAVVDKPFLGLFGPAHILVQQGSGPDVIIEIDAAKADEFSIAQQSLSSIAVVAPPLPSRGLTGGSIVGGNVYINNGTVIMNGVQQKNDPEQRYPRLRITVPNIDGLGLNTSAQSKVEIQPEVYGGTVILSGQAEATLSTCLLNAEISGQSELNLAISRTALKEIVAIKMSGQSELKATGDFGHVKIVASGQAEATTEGDVAGNYVAIASGQSEITHRGNIAGERTNQKSGQASIKLG